MKHKIIINVLIIAIMLIAAIFTYENAPTIAQALGASVRFVNTSAAGMSMAIIFPISSINAIRREAKSK